MHVYMFVKICVDVLLSFFSSMVIRLVLGNEESAQCRCRKFHEEACMGFGPGHNFSTEPRYSFSFAIVLGLKYIVLLCATCHILCIPAHDTNFR